MPLNRFEECWPLPTESLPELPANLNTVTLTLTLWPINSGLLTSLLLPHLSSSLTDSLPSLNLLCYSKTDARFMQDAPKAVWSIPYVSVAFFPSLKQNFIAYRSSKESDCIFEIHQLWESGFNRVYSNSYCCIVIFWFIQHYNDTIPKTDAWRKTREETTQEDFFTNIHLSLYL